LSSSGLPRPSFACDRIIEPCHPHSTPCVPLPELDHTPLICTLETPYTDSINQRQTHANRSPLSDPLRRLPVALPVVPHSGRGRADGRLLPFLWIARPCGTHIIGTVRSLRRRSTPCTDSLHLSWKHFLRLHFKMFALPSALRYFTKFCWMKS